MFNRRRGLGLILLVCGTCTGSIEISACTRAPTSPLSVDATPTDKVERAGLRDQARVVLERHCGECHIRAYETALPNALKVYDLTQPEWAERMSLAQLKQLSERVASGPLFDAFDTRSRGKAPPAPPTAEEQALVRRFVTAELAARAARSPAP